MANDLRKHPIAARRPWCESTLVNHSSHHTELIGLCRWLISDGPPLDRQERITRAMEELGFKRRGKKIVERLERAVDIAQDLADKAEG